MPDNRQSPSFWDRVKEAPLWMKIVVPVVVLIAVIAAIPAPEDEDGDGEVTTEAVAIEEAPEPEPEPIQGVLDDALDDADPTAFGAVATSLDVKEVERFPAVVNVALETPEGGFEGPSVDDLDGSAAAAFEAIYADADWQRGATVEFTGGLVDTRTGRDLPDERTGLYRITAREGSERGERRTHDRGRGGDTDHHVGGL